MPCTMLPLLLLSHIAVSIGAPVDHCDLSIVGITGGSYTVSDDGNFGSKLEYTCPKGKYPHPVSSRECRRNGAWTREKEPAECKDVECPKPWGFFENGRFSPVLQTYPVGSTLHFECYDGFNLFGSETRTCKENGKWSGKTAICDDQEGHCPNPGIPIGATKSGTDYRADGKVIYKCHRGLKMFGSNERICKENTQWSGREPSCRQPYTYDTPEEVAAEFGSTLSGTIESSDPDRVEIKDDRNIKIREDGLMNIFVLIDASSSVGPAKFSISKEIAEILMMKVSSFEIEPRYSILTYASKVKPIVTITDKESKDTNYVLEMLRAFDYTEHGDKQGTNTRAALQEVYDQLSLFKIRKPEFFFNTSNIIILLTDGKYNMGGNPVVEVDNIKKFLHIDRDGKRDDKLDIYVFGLTEDINEEELNGIASKKHLEDHVFKMKSIEDLKRAFDKIIDDAEVLEMCGISKEYSQEENERYPWIAKVVITRDDGVDNCKGSVVTKNFILTAAHCFRIGDEAKWLTVDIGRESFKAKNIDVHPKYQPESKKDKKIAKFYGYDFALIELSKPLVYSSTIRPICLPCTNKASWALRLRGRNTTCPDHRNLLLNRDLVDVSFISKTKTEEYSDLETIKVNVTIKQGEKRHSCLNNVRDTPMLKNVTDIEELVTDDFFCTGGTDITEELQTCKGDSGGPLLIEYKHRYVQVGVVSWGNIDSCDGFKRHTVPSNSQDFHADVFKAMDWIKQKLADEL